MAVDVWDALHSDDAAMIERLEPLPNVAVASSCSIIEAAERRVRSSDF